MAAAPNCGRAFRARSWIGSCGLQKSAIVSDKSRPWRTEANTCWSKIRVKNDRNAASMTAAGHAPFRTNVAWSSSDALVAAVNAAGVITGTRAGIATITAVSGNSTGTTTVQVNAGPPAVLSYYQGEGQIAPAGSFLADPLCTLVKDAAGNLIIGVAVTYTVATGGGIIREPLSPKTDARGVAVSGGFSLGPTPGVQTVIATSGTAPPLVFHETAQ